MDVVTLKKYFATEAKLAGLESAQLDERIDAAIEIGLADFWGYWDWKFKLRLDTFTVSTTADSYNLPLQFGGLKSIRETTSTNGQKLWFLEKEEFDRLVPKPSAWTSGTPQYYTLTFDINSPGPKISFYPRPSGSMTFQLLMYQNTPGSVQDIPPEFAGGLVSVIAKYVYPIGSEGRARAELEAFHRLEKLKTQDKQNKGKIFRFTSADDEPERTLPWV